MMVNIGVIRIEITEDMRVRAREIAHLRNDAKVAAGIKTEKWGDKTPFQIHYEGALAELAVEKWLGTACDESFSWTGDDGYDMVLPFGWTIEVKYRDGQYSDFGLKSRDPDGFKADIGILVWPSNRENVLEIVGWTTKIHFIKKCIEEDYIGRRTKTSLSKNKRLSIRRQDMLDPHELVEIIERYNELSEIAKGAEEE